MNLYSFDDSYRRRGYFSIAGVDEAGRGPWAGPVVAAAVVLPYNVRIDGLNDSKKLTPKQRESVYSNINKSALSVTIEVVGQNTIDTLNILQATHAAMSGALRKINIPLDMVLVDGFSVTGLELLQKAVVKGDSKSASIAAASVIAKVTRDRIMVELSCKYPNYNFKKHKGYGTKEHYQALVKYGPCPLHRKSFNPVRQLLGSGLETGKGTGYSPWRVACPQFSRPDQDSNV